VTDLLLLLLLLSWLYDRIEIWKSKNNTGSGYGKTGCYLEKTWKRSIECKYYGRQKFHYINNKWYIYFAAARNWFEIWSQGICSWNTSDDPLKGKWEEKRSDIKWTGSHSRLMQRLLNTGEKWYLVLGAKRFPDTREFKPLYFGMSRSMRPIKGKQIIDLKTWIWVGNNRILVNEGAAVYNKKR